MSEFNFNAVEENETVLLPKMLSKGVFKNQIELIDPLRLKELTALIIGAGSVGSNLVHTMNKFGFSSFIIYDYDIWEVHNSASSIYPFKETEAQAPYCKRSYDQWTYYPTRPVDKEEIDLPPYSIFKVDILKREIERNDPNIYYEEYRLPFGESMINAFTKFNQSIDKIGARRMFTNEGQPRRSSMGVMKFDWIPKVKPDYMVLTTDTLQSRARCVWALRSMFKNDVWGETEGVFPVIDTRSLNTTQGEILVFDLMNDQDVHDWFNYSLPHKARMEFKDMENVLNDDIENVEQIGFIDTEPNLCGDKMSILISNTISVYATNLIVNIFNGKVEWEKIPRSYLINTSPLMPYVTKNAKLLNE